MKLNRENLIRFYDHRRERDNPEYEGFGSHVSAITGLIGEDLIFGLLQKYWISKNHVSEILSYKCSQGTRKGARLDAWILFNNLTLYQVEVKNWAAHSMGGQSLQIDANATTQKAFSDSRKLKYFGPNYAPVLYEKIKKVLEPMNPPNQYNNLEVKKLICLWDYMVCDNNEPFFEVEIDKQCLHVFSASAYLRSLTDEVIELSMPRAEKRQGYLNDLIVKP